MAVCSAIRCKRFGATVPLALGLTSLILTLSQCKKDTSVSSAAVRGQELGQPVNLRLLRVYTRRIDQFASRAVCERVCQHGECRGEDSVWLCVVRCKSNADCPAGTLCNTFGYDGGAGSIQMLWYNREVCLANRNPVQEIEIVSGGLDKEQVRVATWRRHTDVEYCFETGIARKPNLGGRIILSVTITEGGAVAGVAQESSSVSDRETEECIRAAVGQWKFPETNHRKTTVARLVLSPGW